MRSPDLWFKAVGATPRVMQETIHHETVVGLVAAGVGLSILPESVSKFRIEGVVIRPITAAPRTSLMIARPGRVGGENDGAAGLIALDSADGHYLLGAILTAHNAALGP
ncbi:hypothetical protein GXW84_37825 [Rhodococcus sp. IEGM 248]|uniref:LysR substrate-binding domain-containing protein n=1 Tax=Rhodococcus opacus TaxID=37919 RepID=UPI0013C29339|nr:hypothetical protein [Rhodococcus sp. IEGM 248]